MAHPMEGTLENPDLRAPRVIVKHVLASWQNTMRPRTMKMSAATREKSMLQSVQYVANVTWPSLTLHAWGLKVRGASSDRKMALDITFM